MKTVPLKTAVWEMHNGPVPDGKHVKQTGAVNDYRAETLTLADGPDPVTPTAVIEIEE